MGPDDAAIAETEIRTAINETVPVLAVVPNWIQIWIRLGCAGVTPHTAGAARYSLSPVASYQSALEMP